MADDGIKLGSAYVEFDARVKEAEAELAGFEVRVEQTASRAQTSADKTATAYEDSSRRSVTALQAVENALTGLGGADPGKVAQATQLVDGIESASQRAKTQAAEMGRVISEVQSEADLKLSGIGHNFENMGSSAERAGKKVAKSGTEMASGIEQAGNAARKLQSVFSTILIPAAVVASVAGLVNKVRETRLEAERMEASFKKAADSIVDDFRRAELARNIDAGQLLQVDTITQARAQIDSINASLDDYLIKNDNLLHSVKGVLGGQGDIDSRLVESANQQVSRIESALQRRLQIISKINEETQQASIEQAREIAESLRPDEGQDPLYAETARVSEELDQKIEALKEIRKGLDEAGQAVVTQLIIGAYQDAEARTREVTEKNRAEMAESLKREAEQLRDASLTPIQKEIKALEQRRDEVLGQLDSGILKGFDGLDATARALVEQINSSIKELMQSQNEALKELPVRIGEEVRDAIDRALSDSSIARTPTTLDAMYNALNDLVLQTLRRS